MNKLELLRESGLFLCGQKLTSERCVPAPWVDALLGCSLWPFVHHLGFLQFCCFPTCVLSILGSKLAQCHLSQCLKEDICLKTGENQFPLLLLIEYGLLAFGPQPQSQTSGFQIWSDEKYRLVISGLDVTCTSFQSESCCTPTEFV